MCGPDADLLGVEAPDVIVTWLQNEYGQLGRAAESVAHALQTSGLARQVAYVEPNVEGPEPPSLEVVKGNGVHVYRQHGAAIPGAAVAAAVLTTSDLHDPILLNFGVDEANWLFHGTFAALCSTTALVTHDIVHLWPGLAPRDAALRKRIRSLLVRSSETVVGLSLGSIADLDGAHYVGHGCDSGLESAAVDTLAQPADLAAIPHPRALYVGALSTRIDTSAIAALAASGVQVVLIGFSPSSQLEALIDSQPNVHYLGSRTPPEAAAYMRHCDVGIVPHTDDPFTRSMEPHKVYNYSCAGLRSILLNCACPPALTGVATCTTNNATFVRATRRALGDGRLSAANVAAARSLTWTSVAAKILDTIRTP